jgi:hypothetical protein
VRFATKGGAYELSTSRDGEKAWGDLAYPVKTLSVGGYQFLALRLPDENGGRLQRYTISDRLLELYFSDGSDLNEFVKARYPLTVNFKQGSDGSYMEIGPLDDEVFTILSKIPDTKTYWNCEERYQKVP